MIGVVIVTHGNLAESFIDSAEQVVGTQTQIEALCLHPQDEIEASREQLIQAKNRVDSGKGVIILTDMFGGVASNLAMMMLSMPRIEVIAGVNLPMLVRILSKRHELSLAECTAQAQEAGRKYINIATQLLEPKKKAG